MELQSELDKTQHDKAMLQALNERLHARVTELENILLEVSRPVQPSPRNSPDKHSVPLPARSSRRQMSGGPPPTRPIFATRPTI